MRGHWVVRRALTCLVAGVLATVATSWCGVVLFGATEVATCERPLNEAAGEGNGLLSVSRATGPGVVVIYATAGLRECGLSYLDDTPPGESEQMMPSWCRDVIFEQLRDHPQLEIPESELSGFVMVEARGWPLPALWCVPAKHSWCFGRDEPAVGGIAMPVWMDLTRDRGVDLPTLPCRPIWTGLAVNTVTFAAAIGLLLPVPRLIVERRRARRGGCVACGYDLRHSPAGCPCPECGDVRGVGRAPDPLGGGALAEVPPARRLSS